MTPSTLLIAAGLLGISISPSLADDFKAALRQCEEQATARMESSQHSSTTTSAVNGAATIFGAIIAGYDPKYALAGATQSGIHGIANDAQAAEYRRQSLIDQCMNEKRK